MSKTRQKGEKKTEKGIALILSSKKKGVLRVVLELLQVDRRVGEAPALRAALLAALGNKSAESKGFRGRGPKGCIGASDSEKLRMLLHFFESTRFAHVHTAPNSKFQQLSHLTFAQKYV